MDLLAAITERLKLSQIVTDLVGSGNDARITQGNLPQRPGNPKAGQQKANNTGLPAIVLHEISTGPESQLSGSAGTSGDRVQIDCYAVDPVGAGALREAVRWSMLASPRGYWGTLFVQSCVHEGGSGDKVFSVDGSDKHLSRRILEFVIYHEEPIPV